MGFKDDTREAFEWAIRVGNLPRYLVSDVLFQTRVRQGTLAIEKVPDDSIVLQAGAMQPLLFQLHQNSKLSMLRNATWTLSNFCRGKPQPDFELV
jgi:importin subunit alpha-6/7